ncbi:hypothetical protein EYC84_006009 [Monilinia fructicola]|uniref:Uncharacterized protein n=1 Tax=Monilinia fructicola TaxID=38448 RepID=A0A5M9K0Y0_MONFR|nr:hypothetical protein EYC84_006009 [Monilinia fructicola]
MHREKGSSYIQLVRRELSRAKMLNQEMAWRCFWFSEDFAYCRWGMMMNELMTRLRGWNVLCSSEHHA